MYNIISIESLANISSKNIPHTRRAGPTTKYINYQVIITFEPRKFIQNRGHRYNPPIKAQVQSHMANRLKLLCHFERFWANERASILDLGQVRGKTCGIIGICCQNCPSPGHPRGQGRVNRPAIGEDLSLYGCSSCV